MPSKGCLAVILFPILAGNHVLAKPMKTCGDQKGCTTWTVAHVDTPTCSNAAGCQFKVCLSLRQGAGCVWAGNDISHTCLKSPTACPAEPIDGFKFATEKTDWKLGATQCQVGAGGSDLQFLLKDGSRCSDGASVSTFSLGDVFGTEAACEPRKGDIASCTGNGVGKECIWSVTLPDCTCQEGYHFDRSDGCIQDCFCNFGVSDQSKCPKDLAGSQHCTSCDDGFDLIGGECSIRTCSCAYGSPTTGTECAQEGQKNCASCLDGYEMAPLDGGRQHCQEIPEVKECECYHGQAATGESCPANGAEVCVSCDPNYEVVLPSKICTLIPDPNICLCDNGSPVSTEMCTATDAQECSSCTPPFELQPDKTCQEPHDCSAPSADWTEEMTKWCCEKKDIGCPPQECVCLFGTVASGDACPADAAVACESCYLNYRLVNGQCVPECTCTNGVAALGAKCPGPGQHVCDSCNEGYDLGADAFCVEAVPPNVCQCPGGEEAKGEDCPGPDAIACASCGDGFVLVGDKCDPKEVCTCTGGTAVAENECPEGGGEICGECDDAHFLDDITCREKVCQCAGGVAATGAACEQHGEVLCTTCEAGYDFDEATKTCKVTDAANVCICTDGNPVDSDSCEEHGKEVCESCDEGYEFNSGTKLCEKDVSGGGGGGGGGETNLCKCLYGEAATGEKCKTGGAYVCESCQEGFDLVNEKCVPGSVNGGDKECTCSGGTAATDARCFMAGKEVCTGCRQGFEFHPFISGGTVGVCKPKIPDTKVCKCSGGTSAVGGDCPATGTEACIHCNEGFNFIKANGDDVYGTCEAKVKVCRCRGGMPAMGGRCPIRGMKACTECSGGYDFVPWPGANPLNLGTCVEMGPSPVDPGSVESMPVGGNIADRNVAAAALGASALPKESDTTSDTMFGSPFIACFAGCFFSVGLFLGLRTWKRERRCPEDSASLLPKMLPDIEADQEIA